MRITSVFIWGSFLLLSVNFEARSQQKTLPPVTVTAVTNIETAVTNSFDRSFPDALDAQWFRLSRRYLVRFMADDQQNSALIKRNGQIVYQIAYGYEKDLPADERMLVRKAYPDFSISKVIRVNEDQRTIWVVTVEDKTKLMLVRIENGELEEVSNYNKR